jgi:hypothetical protein
MRLNDPEIDVLAIVVDNSVVYFNNDNNHLFGGTDKDGDKKLKGRVARVVFNGQLRGNTTEFFVAFDEEDSHSLFTLQMGINQRFDYVIRAIFNYYHRNSNVLSNTTLFAPQENFSTQYFYAFHTYKKGDLIYMNNNSNTEVYLIEKDNFIRNDRNALQKRLSEKRF